VLDLCHDPNALIVARTIKTSHKGPTLVPVVCSGYFSRRDECLDQSVF
jgi:hypothetical protein